MSGIPGVSLNIGKYMALYCMLAFCHIMGAIVFLESYLRKENSWFVYSDLKYGDRISRRLRLSGGFFIGITAILAIAYGFVPLVFVNAGMGIYCLWFSSYLNKYKSTRKHSLIDSAVWFAWMNLAILCYTYA